MKLPPDDLIAGRYVTATRWQRKLGAAMQEDAQGNVIDERRMVNFEFDTKLNGAIMRVEALMMPFVAVKIVVSPLGDILAPPQGIALDTREIDFMTVSPEYMAAFGYSPPAKGQPDPMPPAKAKKKLPTSLIEIVQLQNELQNKTEVPKSE